MRRAGLGLALGLALMVPGCLDLTPARVPDRLLEGAGGNGWEKNASASQRAASGSMFSKSQTLVYTHPDAGSGQGYQGTLAVSTLRTALRPSEESVRQTLQTRIHDNAAAQGITLSGSPRQGTRTLADHAEAFWFAYDGSVSSGSFFSTDATVKIYGEVFQCPTAKTLVATVGLAQVTNVRSVGGVALPSDEDATTWDQIVGDAAGTIDGVRDTSGLAWNVAC